MKALKNPVWLGVFLAVVSVVVAVLLHFAGRPIKRLRIDVLSNSPLVSINTDIAKEIQVLYKGRSVQTLSLVLLRFENSGNEPIRESDYSEPIQISISDSAEIGEVQLQETRPDGIRMVPRIVTRNQVELEKALLNPGDQAVVKILALNNDSTLRINGRIAGVRDLSIQSVLEKNASLETTDPLVWLVLAAGGLAILIVIFLYSRTGMGWRKTRFGFDPARYYYILAQEGMIKGIAEKNPIGHIVGYLEKAFSWDAEYVDKAATDPLFSPTRFYEPYQSALQKFTRDAAPTIEE